MNSGCLHIVQQLRRELTCSICFKSFLSPTTLACGHNFCHACLVSYCGQFPIETACPRCQEKIPRLNFIPNVQLANITKLVEELSVDIKQITAEGHVCQKHPPTLQAFCRNELVLFCSRCDLSREHLTHDVVPVAEAAREYKVGIFDRQPSGLISSRTDRLDRLAVQGTRRSLLQHQSSKASILWRSASLMVQLSQPYIASGKTTFHLGDDLRQLCFFVANVILDPDTAHPKLILSEDLKSCWLGRKSQNLINDDKRFDLMTCVLGREMFVTGRHYWDVAVENVGDWGVRVARSSMKRQGIEAFRNMEGIWVMAKCCGRFWVYINPPTLVSEPMRWEIKKIRVSLNCAGGRVAFCDVERGNLLSSFLKKLLFKHHLCLFFFLPCCV
uniref:Uncharacterized protein n=1 Tax=Naja naja TaxID=35670 RepID=A0A8C6VHV0_NAJNA